MRTRQYANGVLLLLLSSHALASAVKEDTQSSDAQIENVVKQDKAFKMSPQDKTFGNKIDDTDKYSKPSKEPKNGDLADSKEVLDAEKVTNDGNDPMVLDDYDPNRLGVSAEDAVQESKSPKKDSKKEPVPQKDDTSEESLPNHADPKAGLSTGKGEGSGGVGAGKGAEADKPSAGDVKKGSAAEGSALNGVAATDAIVDPKDKLVVDEVNQSQEAGFIGSLHHFLAATSMIVFAEIGDKTFFIAALMAMRHPAFFVFSASYSSLAIMTILSAFLGMLLPSLLSPRVTSILAAGLFVVFGFKLLKEGLALDANAGAQDELHEVEHEIELKEANTMHDDAEKGHVQGTSESQVRWLDGLRNFAGLIFSPAWVQIFVMTFLGEWGDRSQIATVAMAAGSHYWQIIFGALLGHAVCTLLAVYGGKLLATKISMRTITLGGAASFFIFAILYFLEGLGGTNVTEIDA